MNISEIQPYVTLMKDVLTGLVACVTAYVAIIGLQTWKKQLKANAEYDLARRVLIAVYKVKNAINNCRIFIDPRDNLEEARKRHDVQIVKVDDSISNLAVELLEAQAVWGDEKNFNEKFNDLYYAASYMKSAIQTYYSENTSEKLKDEYFLQIFYSPPQGKGNIDILLENAVYQIEDLMRPKLRLKRGSKRRKWAQRGERLY